ncbi:hypothetical protein ACH6CV_09915 [Bacillota bacterium Meth-B3]
MKYGILLRPHANGRYQQAVQPLALCEALALLSAAGIDAKPRLDELFGAGIICFEAPELSERACALLALHSLNYLLCEVHGDRLAPVGGRAKAFLGHDLNGIQIQGQDQRTLHRLLGQHGVAVERVCGCVRP